MPSPTDADAEVLAWVHRGWDQLRLQRPLAAWAAWQRALRIKPRDPAATQALDLLAAADDLPAAARVPYRFRPPRDAAARDRWDARFRNRSMDDLEVAADAFGGLAHADPADVPARYKQALCLAWLGENLAAIEALQDAVTGEAVPFPESAIEAWTLAEVLRQGAGAEELADDLSHTLSLRRLGAAGDTITWLVSFANLRPVPVPAGQAAAFEWLDRLPPEPAEDLTVGDLPRVLAGVLVAPGLLRCSSPDRGRIEEVERRLRAALGDRDCSIERSSTPLPISLMDAAVFLVRLPDGLDGPTRMRLLREVTEEFYENVWVNSRRHGLGGAPALPGPGAMAGLLELVQTRRAEIGPAERVAVVKLEAVIRLREQLARRPCVAALYAGYPFDRLRRRVGLGAPHPATVDPADVSCMSAGELDRLDPATLDDATLDEACRSARAISSPGLVRLAAALAARAPASVARAGVVEHPRTDLEVSS